MVFLSVKDIKKKILLISKLIHAYKYFLIKGVQKRRPADIPYFGGCHQTRPSGPYREYQREPGPPSGPDSPQGSRNPWRPENPETRRRRGRVQRVLPPLLGHVTLQPALPALGLHQGQPHQLHDHFQVPVRAVPLASRAQRASRTGERALPAAGVHRQGLHDPTRLGGQVAEYSQPVRDRRAGRRGRVSYRALGQEDSTRRPESDRCAQEEQGD